MEINEIARKVTAASGKDKIVADMLKEIFMYQRSSTGNYKAKYREIIEKYAEKEEKKK